MDINKYDKRQLHELAKEYHQKTGLGGYYLDKMIESGEITNQERWDKFVSFIKELIQEAENTGLTKLDEAIREVDKIKGFWDNAPNYKYKVMDILKKLKQ